MTNFSHYNKSSKKFARKLRNNSTLGEVILWRDVLSRRQMMGLQFNRQFPIDKYIADFICRKIRLIIEVDGYSHNNRQEYDLVRDSRLKELGFITLRIAERDVYRDINNVILEIQAKVAELQNESPSPL